MYENGFWQGFEYYLETHFTGESDCENIVCFAEIIVSWVILVHRILSSDGEAWEHDDNHDELVKGRGTNKPVDNFPHTTKSLMLDTGIG